MFLGRLLYLRAQMRLNHLIANLPVELAAGSPEAEITDVVDDSRRVSPGCLFVARRGSATDGGRYLEDAVAGGAAAVLCDAATEVPPGAAHLAARDVHESGARLAERVHGDPSRTLALLGVTGTNGKTTTATLIHQILNRAGFRCGLIGTVEIDEGSQRQPAELTTPAAVDISRLLGRMVRSGCRACVMEVSSHALQQGRTAALHFTGAVFTNISGDHLDYHGSMSAYTAAKARLFEAIEREDWGVINGDDGCFAAMADACRGRVVSTSLTGAASASCHAQIHAMSIRATGTTMRGPWGVIETELPLVGQHNVCNALQAVASCQQLGLDIEMLRDGLSNCRAPRGRLEPVTAQDDPFTVLIDYAHTDDALMNVLNALRPLVPHGGRLCTVFGCGGDRDRTKRSRMAAAAWRFSDEVIVTSDNPRTEDPEAIIDDIFEGISSQRRQQTKRLPDRREAIQRAIEEARAGDVILIAGKGHEDYQIIGTTRRHFDDREEALAALNHRMAGITS